MVSFRFSFQHISLLHRNSGNGPDLSLSHWRPQGQGSRGSPHQLLQTPCRHKMRQFSNSLNRRGLKMRSPVQSHLGVERNLISATNQTELLTTFVVGRPVVLTRVGFVGPCSVFSAWSTWHFKARNFGTCPVCIAELTLRDVFAAVSFTTLSDGSLKRRYFIFCDRELNVGLEESMNCLPSYSQDRHSFHESRRWARLSLCTCECAPANGSWTKQSK